MKRFSRSVIISAALAFAFALVPGRTFAAQIRQEIGDKPSAGISGSHIYVAAPGEVPSEVSHTNGELQSAVVPGSTVYFEIDNALRAEDLAGVRALIDWQEGEEMAEAPKIEYKMMYDRTGREKIGYRYVVALPIRESAAGARFRLRGEVMVAPRLTEKEPRFAFSITAKTGSKTISADSILCQRNQFVLEFGDNIGQITLMFGEVGRFDIDAEGQGRVNVGFRTDELTDIADRYSYAGLEFIDWPAHPIFNRVGQLILYSDPGRFLYELIPGGLRQIENSYVEEEEYFVINTRRLGTYVIADQPLDRVEYGPVKENPPTGAGKCPEKFYFNAAK